MAFETDRLGLRGWMDNIKENAWGYVVVLTGHVLMVGGLIWLALNPGSIPSYDVNRRARFPSSPEPASGLIYKYQCNDPGDSEMIVFKDNGDAISCRARAIPLGAP